MIAWSILSNEAQIKYKNHSDEALRGQQIDTFPTYFNAKNSPNSNLRPRSHLQAETDIQADHISHRFSLPDKLQVR